MSSALHVHEVEEAFVTYGFPPTGVSGPLTGLRCGRVSFPPHGVPLCWNSCSADVLRQRYFVARSICILFFGRGVARGEGVEFDLINLTQLDLYTGSWATWLNLTCIVGQLDLT